MTVCDWAQSPRQKATDNDILLDVSIGSSFYSLVEQLFGIYGLDTVIEALALGEPSIEDTDKLAVHVEDRRATCSAIRCSIKAEYPLTS